MGISKQNRVFPTALIKVESANFSKDYLSMMIFLYMGKS